MLYYRESLERPVLFAFLCVVFTDMIYDWYIFFFCLEVG